MSQLNSIEFQILRMKTIYKVSTDKDLAKSLGVSSQAMAVSKKKGVNPVWFIKAADKMNASLDWLVYGIGSPYRA